ncbi:MAG: fimbria/pilus periplasmic chaperone [Polyangiaceae bacterium]
MQLSATQELAFFPALLELAPGETRRIRVAALNPSIATERSYRLFVNELPAPDAERGGAVRVLTRLGVPVFQQPDKPHAKPLLVVRAEHSRLYIALQNKGNSYFLARSLHVVGRARSGTASVEQDLAVWYVLAQGQRLHELPLSEQVCRELVEVTLTAKTDHGDIQSTYKMPANACVPN